MTPASLYAMTDAAPPPAEEMRKPSLFYPVVIGVIVVACLVGWIANAIRGTNDQADGYDAQVACKDFVKDRLKAPSTADFSGLSHTGSSPRWTVTGAVDAENSFGAKLRMNWTCTVRLDGDAWKLESLTGLQ